MPLKQLSGCLKQRSVSAQNKHTLNILRHVTEIITLITIFIRLTDISRYPVAASIFRNISLDHPCIDKSLVFGIVGQQSKFLHLNPPSLMGLGFIPLLTPHGHDQPLLQDPPSTLPKDNPPDAF